MTVSTMVRVVAAMTMMLGAAHCAAPDQGGETTGAPAEEGAAESAAEGDIGQVSQATVSHCWAQIGRPIPGDPFLQIGTALKLRTSTTLNCPMGVPETLAYRFYIEGPSGRVSPQGPTGWSLTRIVDFSTTGLQPGRYKIYAYSLPVSLIPAWLANDTYARHASTRSGNTYVELVDAEWSSTSWSACSASCGGGTQTRDVKCKNANHTEVVEAFCADAKPASTQACNVEACPDPCDQDPSAPGCPGFDMCIYDPMMPGCPGWDPCGFGGCWDPCMSDPFGPGCSP